MTDVNLTEVGRLVREQLPGVYVELWDTGGGCVTLRVGRSYDVTFPDEWGEGDPSIVRVWDAEDQRGDLWPVQVGPGWWERNPDLTATAFGDTDDLYTGWDQDVPDYLENTTNYSDRPDVTPAQIAADVVRYWNTHPRREHWKEQL